MRTIEIEVLINQSADGGYDLHSKDNYCKNKTVSSGVRAREFPQLEGLKTLKPLRARLIIEVPEREEGFYWVKRNDELGWEVAEWNLGEWDLTGFGTPFNDSQFIEIDENKLERANL